METKPQQIDVVSDYLKRLRAAIVDLGVFPRYAAVLFDAVTCCIVSKSFSVADAALILLRNWHPDEAFGLVRTSVECAMNLRYLTAVPDEREERAVAFAKYHFKEQQYWLAQANQFMAGHHQDALDEMNRHAAAMGIVADAKPALGHWSGERGFVWVATLMNHPLDGTTYPERMRNIMYATNYHQTSAYVHGSMRGVDHLLPDSRAVFNPRTRSAGDQQEGQKALYVIVESIHACARYALFGMQVEHTQAIDALFTETIAKLDPIQRQTRLPTSTTRYFA